MSKQTVTMLSPERGRAIQKQMGGDFWFRLWAAVCLCVGMLEIWEGFLGEGMSRLRQDGPSGSH